MISVVLMLLLLIVSCGGVGEEYIRVALHDTGFVSLVHSDVQVTACGPFLVNGQRKRAGAIFVAEEGPYEIRTQSARNMLQILSIQRNQEEAPRYRGALTVTPADGGFTVVNTLPLEEYLYSVVPSEMPAGHGKTAAKVQAVTARSFAVQQMNAGLFAHMGADLCDSVMSQVYNNLPETDMSKAAVRATRGLVLTVDGEVVATNYFSTSAGHTAYAGEVWGFGGAFPVDTPVHLTARPQYDRRLFHSGDLSMESYARRFFSTANIPAFDRDFPWFRWAVTLTAEDLRPLFGELHIMEVTRRGAGGNVMEMRFVGSEGEHIVQTELAVRRLLSPAAATVYRHDGSTVAGMPMLPSGFFVMDIENCTDTISSVTFIGGGHGHGVGMSQNGVKFLSEAGLGYRQIIGHFFPGSKLTNKP